MSNAYLNRSEAAKAIGKSEPTLDAYLKAGEFPNAKKVKRGNRQVWQIPLSDLHHYLDKVAADDPGAEAPAPLLAKPNQVADKTSELNATINELRLTIATLEAKLEAQERVISTMEKARADLIAAYAPQIETATKQAERRRWFARSGS